MLAKMGWAAGKGLGAKEDGVTEPVKAFKKLDNSGLLFIRLCTSRELVSHHDRILGVGCKKTSIDNWLENADAFNDLLARLNEDEVDENSSSVGSSK